MSRLSRLVKNSDLRRWILANRQRCCEMEFFDTSIQLAYNEILAVMTPLQRKIILSVLFSYLDGITPTEIAKVTFTQINTVTVALNRLRGLGIVSRRREGKYAYYFVPDLDFLRVCAVRWDGRFRKFLDANRDRWEEDIITEYIKGVKAP